MAAGPRFQQGRKDWAAEADPLVEKCYQDYWEITTANILLVEMLVHAEHDRAGGYNIHQILDYGGLDKAIILDSRLIHISERVRPYDPENDEFRPDMSVRTDNGVNGRHPEVTKWVTAFKEHGYTPDLFAYGIFNTKTGVLEEFYLVDTVTVIQALSEPPYPGVENPNTESRDGTMARYISPGELKAMGAVIAEWTNITPDYTVTPGTEPLTSHAVPLLQQVPRTQTEWPSRVDELATQCYMNAYNVNASNVYDIDELVDAVHEKEAAKRTRAGLKAAGLDRVVDCGDRHIHITQQWKSNTDRRELTLCTDNGIDGVNSLLKRWIAGYLTHGYYPTAIAFGAYDGCLGAFSEFYIVDTEQIIKRLLGKSKPGRVIQRDDGTKDRCISIRELEEMGAVMMSWDGVAPN